jgi:hypothetical protein
MNLFFSKGVIRYEGSTTDPFKVFVQVNSEITRLARALIPPYMPFNYPRYEPHISVVRKETPDPAKWKLFPRCDELVEFAYNPEVQNDETYYWLQVFCPELSALRVELGLPPSRANVTLSPNGDAIFHITVGNAKGM